MSFEAVVIAHLVLGVGALLVAFGDELAQRLPRLDRALHRALGGDR